MCLILLAWHSHPAYPCVLAANRDEFFARPSCAMAFWRESPGLLAGRDLRAGGTWMGMDRRGRFAALTNYRAAGEQRANAPSRGGLVAAFVAGDSSAEAFWASIDPDEYNGFNLICGDLRRELWHFSNRCDRRGQRLAPGIYGLSNHLLDTPWPKVAQGKSALCAALESLPEDGALFDLLRDDALHDDSLLPRTGVDLHWERLLSAAFVRSPDYGTRSSTVLLLGEDGTLSADEQSFARDAKPTERKRFRFSLA